MPTGPARFEQAFELHQIVAAQLQLVGDGGEFGIGHLLGGSVLVETVTGWPGVGQLIYQAISQRDVPVTQGGVLMVSLLFVLLNLTVDVLHGVVDPRIRRAH